MSDKRDPIEELEALGDAVLEALEPVLRPVLDWLARILEGRRR